jgi:hypothetical protein
VKKEKIQIQDHNMTNKLKTMMKKLKVVMVKDRDANVTDTGDQESDRQYLF